MSQPDDFSYRSGKFMKCTQKDAVSGGTTQNNVKNFLSELRRIWCRLHCYKKSLFFWGIYNSIRVHLTRFRFPLLHYRNVSYWWWKPEPHEMYTDGIINSPKKRVIFCNNAVCTKCVVTPIRIFFRYSE